MRAKSADFAFFTDPPFWTPFLTLFDPPPPPPPGGVFLGYFHGGEPLEKRIVDYEGTPRNTRLILMIGVAQLHIRYYPDSTISALEVIDNMLSL